MHILKDKLFITKEGSERLTEGNEISEVAEARGKISKRQIGVIGF